MNTLQVMLHILHGCAPTAGTSPAPVAEGDRYAGHVTLRRSPGCSRPAALSTVLAQVMSLGVRFKYNLNIRCQRGSDGCMHVAFLMQAVQQQLHSCLKAGHRCSIAVHNRYTGDARLVETDRRLQLTALTWTLTSSAVGGNASMHTTSQGP